jgi:hypothetical protein
VLMHHFNDGQIDVPGRNRKRRDGLAHYRVLALGAPAHSQTRPAIRRRIHARGMIARERILKLRSRRRHGHQRLKPPQLASRPQRRAIRFSSLISLLDFPFLPIAAPVSGGFLKNSRFWETVAGDCVRSTLRGGSNDCIRGSKPFRTQSRTHNPLCAQGALRLFRNGFERFTF